MSGSVLTKQKRNLHTTKKRRNAADDVADAEQKKENKKCFDAHKKRPFYWPNDKKCHSDALVEDQGCTLLKPFMCGDGKCIADWSSCNVILQKCMGPLNFYSCMNGECMRSAEDCRNAVDAFNTSSSDKKDSHDEKLKITPCVDPIMHVKCEDGFCRRSCNSIKSSRCELQSPYACGYGTCQTY